VISTAFVLQGVIISFRGPTKVPFNFEPFNGFAPLRQPTQSFEFLLVKTVVSADGIKFVSALFEKYDHNIYVGVDVM